MGWRGGCNAETAIFWSVCSVCPTTLTLPYPWLPSHFNHLSLSLSFTLLSFNPQVSSSLSRVALARRRTRVDRLRSSWLTEAHAFESHSTRAVVHSSLLPCYSFPSSRPSIGGFVGWISRKSPRASGDVYRLHVEYCWITASPVRKGEQIKGYCIYTEAPSDGSDTCVPDGKRSLLIHTVDSLRSSNLVFAAWSGGSNRRFLDD